MEKFQVIFLTEAREFLLGLDEKSRDKIIFNIDKAKIKTDNELFKKLKGEIWEFRTLFNKTYYRIFAFWDKTEKGQALVLTTHGIIKKTGKTPESSSTSLNADWPPARLHTCGLDLYALEGAP